MIGRGAGRRTPFRVTLLALALLGGLIVVNPAMAEGPNHATARAFEHAGRRAEAADAWRAVLDEYPDDEVALRGFAENVVAAPCPHHYGHAEALLVAALERDPHALRLHRLLGQILLDSARRATTPGMEQALAARARALFATVLGATPIDNPARLGLAWSLEILGKRDEAIRAIDGPSCSGPGRGTLIAEKGRLLYERAVALHEATGRSYPLTPTQERAYRQAQGALLGACRAAANDVAGHLRLAWTAQALGEVGAAREAYEAAIEAAPEDPLPLRGIRVLYTHDAAGYTATLERLAAKGPPFDRVLLLQIQDRIARGELDEAEDVLTVFEATYPDDADGHFHRGELLTARGDGEAAQAVYRRAIELDGKHLVAAERIDRAIREGGLARAKASLDAAMGIEAEYAWLLECAPHNPFVRNNVAFLLREAWLAHRADPTWLPVLEAAVTYYEDAVRVIGPWTPEKHRDLPWATRYAYAQIVNDAGVIRQLYEPSRDLERAEHHYVAAMRFSDWGYLDAWTYLRRIYEEQQRWVVLKRLAERASQGLVGADGAPLIDARQKARELAERLQAQGKAP